MYPPKEHMAKDKTYYLRLYEETFKGKIVRDNKYELVENYDIEDIYNIYLKVAQLTDVTINKDMDNTILRGEIITVQRL